MRLARRLGPAGGDEAAAKLSPLRFRHLMTMPDDDLDARRLALLRLVHLLDHRTNVRDLAEAAIAWGDRLRIRWAFQYWDAPDATPAVAAEPIQTADAEEG